MQLILAIFSIIIFNIYVCLGHNRHFKKHDESLIVHTTKGNVVGKRDQTESGVNYLAYQGIPYAKPPLGELRFELPQSFSWKGTWNATYERNECVQAIRGSLLPVKGREDCLYLNIYTPIKSESTSSLKPVMVWIYGGGFVFGSGNKDIYSPDYFIEKDMIVITLNYRLGVFGFLSTGDEIVPGNIGLKDQVFALKWIKENIQFFGGNPSEITLMGESAGAGSVAFLTQSNVAKGLFQRGILQSGTSINGLVTAEKAKRGLQLLGSAFGVVNGTSKEIVDRLKTVDFTSLLLYSVVIMEQLKSSVSDRNLYVPVLENDSKSAVITQPLYDQLKNCRFDSIPIIVGFNSEEALSYEKELNNQRYTFIIYDQNPENLVPRDLNVRDKCDPKEIGKKIKEHYAGKNGSFVFTNGVISRYVSDALFMSPLIEYAKLYSKCNENVYLYRFSYNGGKNTTGAGHVEELRYLFSNFPGTALRKPLSEMDKIVSNNMVSLWSNFMKTGNPTPNQNEFHINWDKSIQNNNYVYLDINEELKIDNLKTAPFKADVEFWDGLYNTCGRIDNV